MFKIRLRIVAVLMAMSACVSVFVAAPAQAHLIQRAADPSVIRVGDTYFSVQSIDDRAIGVRVASSTHDLAYATTTQVWYDDLNRGEVWAPEFIYYGGRFYIYFAAGYGSSHRMFVISSDRATSGYGRESYVTLPDDKWAIDGVPFWWNNERWFTWSGWAGDDNVEQNIYVARMSSMTGATGPRYQISQPREWWERVVGNPYINEAPQPIKDPNGQLHITYSANGSWSDSYCIGDLRLRSGGDIGYVWDWYKSNGCQFGSHQNMMMSGWDATLYYDGPGHHSFVLLYGDIDTSPPAGPTFPLMYHAVPKGTEYNWGNRHWVAGSFAWWGDSTYCRFSTTCNTGWGLKYFE